MLSNYLFRIVTFVFIPFLAEIVIRSWQKTLSFNFAAISFCVALINIIPFISFPKFKKFWTWFYFSLFYIPTLVEICHIFLFVGDIGILALKAVFETNISEAEEFIKSILNWKFCSFLFVVCSIFVSSLIWTLRSDSEKFKMKSWYKFLMILFVIGLVASCFVHDKYKPVAARIIKAFSYYLDEKDFIIECINSRKNFSYGNILDTLKTNERKTYVVVIGESANRDHLSLYGYKRNTTPLLNQIKNELIVFNNVVSAHCQTLEVLKESLTFGNFSNGDVISFFKAAGFKTFWISNQFNGGRWDNIIAIVGQSADVSKFINQSDTQSTNGHCFDELLLEPFQNALNDSAPKKIIFVHLLGSHSIYKNRYPDNFEIFKDHSTKNLQIISEYDNSIAYTDWILFELIQKLRKQNVLSFLLYVSDHGEDVRDIPGCTFFHSPDVATPPMFEIPFIVWLSPKYLSLNSQFVKNWNVNKFYKTDKLIHSIIQLSRLKNDKLKEKESIFED